MADLKAIIESGKTALGIEFGSTRIKAVLIDGSFKPIASGSYSWENQLIDGFWTYSLEDIWKGLRDCYKSLTADVKEKYGAELTKIGSIGFSAMMHGYMAFDEKGELLVPFRTWRNSTTGQAAEALTEMEHFPFISGDFKWGGTCRSDQLSDNAGGLHPLAADRAESPWYRRCFRYVSNQ